MSASQPQSQSGKGKGKGILLLHGPNLNLLGTREPGIYGSATLSTINADCVALGLSLGASNVQTFQTNHEGHLVDRIHEAMGVSSSSNTSTSPTSPITSSSSSGAADNDNDNNNNDDDGGGGGGGGGSGGTNDGIGAIIINPAAFTHQSVAVRDALLGVGIPFVEVHISNVHKREAWRAKSYFSDKAVGVICGLGTFGYEAAVRFCCRDILGVAPKSGEVKQGDGGGEGNRCMRNGEGGKKRKLVAGNN